MKTVRALIRNAVDFCFGVFAGWIPLACIGIPVYFICVVARLSLPEGRLFNEVIWLAALCLTLIFIRRIWKGWESFCVGLLIGLAVCLAGVLFPIHIDPR